MNKVLKGLKITGISLFVIFIVLYLSFVFILPNVATNILDGKKSEIQKLVKEASGLNLEYSNLKVVATPLLSLGVKADSLDIEMPNEKTLVKTGNSVFRLSLPSLLFKTIKVSYLKIENPIVNIDIVDGKKYALEDLFVQNEAQAEPATVSATDNTQALTFDFKYKVDKVILDNYQININDLKSAHYLALKGNELVLKYDGKNITVNTNAGLYSDEDKNISADVNLKMLVPEIQPQASENKVQNNEIPFINLVDVYRMYDLKSNILVKLNIADNNIKGHVDITDTSLKIASVQLPKSYLQLKFDGQKMNIDTNLYLADNENAKVNGAVNYSDKPSLDLDIKTNKIYLSSILKTVNAVMESFNMQNPLATITTEGYLLADAKIKTDYKKLDSKGSIKLVDGYVADKKSALKMTNIKSLISLDNNVLKISDTQAVVNGTPFIVEGSIAQDSSTDIKIYTNNMPLSSLYSTFAPADLKKSYMVKNGILSLNIDLKGKLQELAPVVKTEIVNLVIDDKADGVLITNGLCNVNISTDLKTYKGDVKNSNLVISAPAMFLTLRNSDMAVNFDDKNISIKPSNFVINGTSNFSISGDVKNYVKAPEINILGDGTILTSVLKTLAGKDAAPYLEAKGSLPVKMLISGDAKKQNFVLRLYGNPNGYITPVNFSEAVGKASAIQINADIADNKITFKDSGLFSGVSNDIKQPIGGKQLVSLTGAIGLDKNMTLHSVKIATTTNQNVSICAFDKSKLSANANIVVTGTASNPKLNGLITGFDVSIPQLLTKLSKAELSLNGNTFGYNLSALNLNGSSLNISGSGLLDYKPVITLYGIDVNSDYIDADKVMLVTEAMAKVPALAPSPSASAASQVLPVKITSGNLNIKKLKSGDINASDITSKLLLSNNVVYLNDLKASAFDGGIKGDVSMNIMTSAIKLKVAGAGMDADKTVTACAAMKNTIFGTLGFNADLTLKGATYQEQMKTLKGNADFNITNGQFGSLGKFETFLKADNISSVAFLSTAVGSLVNKVSPHNTAEFSKLNGKVSFNGGNMNISSITSSGKNMSLFINGSMNLLNNNANLLVLGRISNEISSLLGPLNQLNPVNILKSNTSNWASVTLGILKQVNQSSTPSELSKIPALTPAQEDITTSKFIVKINGNLEKPQSAVKSFKWLSSQSDLTQAENAINPVDKVKDVINSLPKSKEETVNTIKEAGKNAILNFGKQLLVPASEGQKNE